MSKQLNWAFFLSGILPVVSNGKYSKRILILSTSLIIKSNRY